MVIADNEISGAPRSILKRGSPSFGKKKKVHWEDQKSDDIPVLVVGTKSWPALSDAQTSKPMNHVEKVAKGVDVVVSVPSVGQAAPRAPIQESNDSGNFNLMTNMPSPHCQKPGPKRKSNTNGTPHFPAAKMPYHKQPPVAPYFRSMEPPPHIAVPAYAFPPGSGPYPNGKNPKPVSSVAAGQESMERRCKTIYITRHRRVNLTDRVSLQDPSKNSMEQQQKKCHTNLNKLSSAFAKLALNEEIRSSKRVRRERINWEEDEDKLFLKGLKKHGKGRWNDISKEFVVTKTSTQIASHAQKYFIHQNVKDIVKRKKRSIHDRTLNKNDTPVTEIPSVEQQNELTPLVTSPMEEHENPPQDTATSRQMQLVLLCPIGSTLPDMNKLEKMCNLFNLLAKEL